MFWKMSFGLGLLTTLAAETAQSPALPPSTARLHGTEQLPSGFLTSDQLPNSFELLPRPPAEGSPGLAEDEAIAEQARSLKDTARWQIASRDADLSFPQATANFACAAGVKIGPDTTPITYQLLAKSLVDIGLSTYRAKDHYSRTRPFVHNDTGTCFPEDEAKIRKDGSYPSGHSAVGWGWALILAELLPNRTNAILVRGSEYGQSRVVCGAHWQSDVNAGRLIGSATVARLHADTSFRYALNKARDELKAAHLKTLPDQEICAAESAALALRSSE